MSAIKAHKYWGIGAFACMLMAMISGYDGRQKNAHHFWAAGAFGCMTMAVYTGYKMVHKKPKQQAVESAENEETGAEA